MAQQITQEAVLQFMADVNSLAKGCNEAASKLDGLDKSFRGIQSGVGFANQALSTFVGMMGTKVVDTVGKAVGFVNAKFNEFVEFAKGATLEAARIEVQWRVLSMTGAKMGVTFDQIRDAVGGLREAGIKTSEALQTMTQWLSAGLPVDKLKELSRSAQDLAVVLGTDSTQAMERFNWFVQTGNSELLRTVGIMQTSTQMEEKFAQGIGKTREQLTDQQRRLARVNGLLEATATYAGAYEQALSDPFKRMTSLTREFSNVVEAVGAIFVPVLGAGVDIVSDLLEKLERLFRVTKKESKETGATIGEWKEGFLKLRAVVTAFANWFLSIWQRLTKGFNAQTESMMDKFVNAIIRGVQAAANALRKFAQFLAGLFGGKAPGEVTTAGMAAVKPTPRAAPKPIVAPAAAPAQVMAAPEEAAKLRAKPVAAPRTEDIAQYGQLMGQWAAMTQKLAQATQAATRAREGLAKAEKWLEAASEKVYDIRRKMEKLERQWAEIPERFTRGRKRQLEVELSAAEHEEHQRQKAVEAEQEKVRLAEEYEREVEKTTNALQSQAEKLGESIAQQTEKYDEWLGKLQEAEAISLVEPVQAVADEFQSLDDLTAGYLAEVEGELLPAFASIEQSVLSIGDNLGRAWEKGKELAAGLLEKLSGIQAWFDGLAPWVQDILKGVGIAVALNFATGGNIGNVLLGAFKLAGLNPAITAGVIAIGVAIQPFLSPETQAAWQETWRKLTSFDIGGAFGAGAAASETTLENSSIFGPILKWVDSLGKKSPEVEAATKEAFYDPMVSTFERASGEIVGASILPEMVESILGWFRRLAVDVVGPLDEFTSLSTAAFDSMANAWIVRINGLVTGLDTLTGRLQAVGAAMKGLAPTPESLQLAANGNFKVVTVNMPNATFGAGVSPEEVKDTIYQAFADLIR